MIESMPGNSYETQVPEIVQPTSHEAPVTTLQKSNELGALVTGDQIDIEWQELALCSQTDPEAFFPGKGLSTQEAKQVCSSCDVKDECLIYALKGDERFGIWGGTSERERRLLKRAQG